MSEEVNTPTNPEAPVAPEPVEQSLDDFEKELFQLEAAPPAKEEKPKEPEEGAEEASATDAGEAAKEPVEEPATKEEAPTETDEGEGKEADPPAKEDKPKNRAQERIQELNAKYREEERRRLEVEDRLRKLEDQQNSGSEQNAESTDVTSDRAPHWEDKNEDGTDKYPLGQFDPAFNAALVRHTMQQEMAREAQARAEQEAQTAAQRQAQALQDTWNEGLQSAQERYPDYMEKGQELIDSMAGIPDDVAVNLTTTLQRMDNGHDVLYYLANNPSEAHAIAAAGDMAAVELGKVSARVATPEKPTSVRPVPKPTAAPPPPPVAKGNSAAKPKNMDDLDEFSRELFRGT